MSEPHAPPMRLARDRNATRAYLAMWFVAADCGLGVRSGQRATSHRFANHHAQCTWDATFLNHACRARHGLAFIFFCSHHWPMQFRCTEAQVHCNALAEQRTRRTNDNGVSHPFRCARCTVPLVRAGTRRCASCPIAVVHATPQTLVHTVRSVGVCCA